MENFTNWEKRGLREFFNSAEMTALAIPVAKIVSKNMLSPQTQSGERRVSVGFSIQRHFQMVTFGK